MVKKSIIKEKYNLPESVKVTIKRSGRDFYAYLDKYPGCMTVAKNFGELIENVNDAILTYFNVPRKEAKKVEFLYFPKVAKSSSTVEKKCVEQIKPLRFTSIPSQCIYA